MRIKDFLGIELPIIQAPMAGIQDSGLAVTVSLAGSLGSLPCCMLSIDALDHSSILLNKELNPDGFNIGINDGQVAGQTVMHLHIHVIPHYQGDRLDPREGFAGYFPTISRWECLDK